VGSERDISEGVATIYRVAERRWHRTQPYPLLLMPDGLIRVTAELHREEIKK